MSDMREAVVLAGGFGTRLRHIVSDVPKPMAPVCGRPFLCYLLDRLAENAFDHVVLSTGYMHEKIADYFGNAYRGMSIAYARETAPLGTGGGILNALQCCESSEVMVLNGDTLFCIDFDALYQRHDASKSELTVVLRHVDDVARYGAVLCDSEGRITSFVEKDASHGAGLINGGVYLMNRHLLDAFHVGDRFSFEADILQAWYAEHLFVGYADSGYFIDIGVPEDYERAQHDFLDVNLFNH